MPKVSVIIPVYNVAPYLKEALDSVVGQTYHNLEILIIDDGSEDGSGELCDEYLCDSRVVVIHQENQGLSAARNTGLDLMTGEYVAFLDSDDSYRPEMIQTLIEETMSRNAGMALCGYDTIRSEGRLDYCKQSNKDGFFFSDYELLISVEAQRRLLNGKIPFSVWSKLYKSYLWKDVRFPVGHVYEDIMVMFRILEKCDLAVIVPEALVYHRKRKGSITVTNNVENICDLFFAERIVKEYVELHIPDVFTRDDFLKYQEKRVRDIIGQYARMYKHSDSSEVIKLIKEEAQTLWANIDNENVCLRSRVMYSLFKKTPNLIIPIRTLFEYGKGTIKTMQHLLSGHQE